MPYSPRYNPQGGPLTINGVALGYTRQQVDTMLGPPPDKEGPGYSSYGRDDGFMVCYKPAWPATGPENWRVNHVLGTVLEQDGRVLLRIGDGLENVRHSLGAPLTTCRTRDGLLILEYPGGYLLVDPNTGKVRDVALKHYTRGRRF